MSEEWEYVEEAIREYQERESRARFERMPALCRRCRWLDWYIFEKCAYDLWPDARGRCSKHCRDFSFIYARWIPSWLRLAWWDVQYRLWSAGQWLLARTANVRVTPAP